jgi:hypothetical protein
MAPGEETAAVAVVSAAVKLLAAHGVAFYGFPRSTRVAEWPRRQSQSWSRASAEALLRPLLPSCWHGLTVRWGLSSRLCRIKRGSTEERRLDMMNFAKGGGRRLALASMLVATAAFCSPSTAAAQHPRHHPGHHHRGHHHHGGGGIGPGAAVGLGLGAFALGTAIGAGAYGYPYGYAPVPAYYAPPVYPYPRSCWYPQYGGYYPC